jgi:hypothetical protein
MHPVKIKGFMNYSQQKQNGRPGRRQLNVLSARRLK